MGLLEGAQESWQCSARKPGTGQGDALGPGHRWLRPGLPEVGGVGWKGWSRTLKMGPISRVEKQTQLRFTPVPRGSGQLRWYGSPGIWVALKDGEQL